MNLSEYVNTINNEEALLWLLTFRDYKNSVELRAVNNLEPIVSRGEVYEPFPFEVKLSPDDGEKVQNISIVFPNVGRELSKLIREFPSDLKPLATLELVLTANPDQIEKTIDFMSIASASYNAQTCTLTMASHSIFARKTCLGTYNQAEFPGIFRAIR